MIEFFPCVRLRPLGKNVELVKFNDATENMNSVEKFMAGVLFRFALDSTCPAVFLRIPKENDEPIEGIRFLKDFDMQRFEEIAKEMFDLASDNFGTKDINTVNYGDFCMLIKQDFMNGEWEKYGYCISGTDGTTVVF